MKTAIYYSIQNGGDGSAYPLFLESMELAEWDQDNMSEGWGERCTGLLEIEHDGPIVVNETMSSFEFYIRMHNSYADYNKRQKADFIEKFFPNGFPEFTIEVNNPVKNHYSHTIFVDGKSNGNILAKKKLTVEDITKMLNGKKI